MYFFFTFCLTRSTSNIIEVQVNIITIGIFTSIGNLNITFYLTIDKNTIIALYIISFITSFILYHICILFLSLMLLFDSMKAISGTTIRKRRITSWLKNHLSKISSPKSYIHPIYIKQKSCLGNIIFNSAAHLALSDPPPVQYVYFLLTSLTQQQWNVTQNMKEKEIPHT